MWNDAADLACPTCRRPPSTHLSTRYPAIYFEHLSSLTVGKRGEQRPPVCGSEGPPSPSRADVLDSVALEPFTNGE